MMSGFNSVILSTSKFILDRVLQYLALVVALILFYLLFGAPMYKGDSLLVKYEAPTWSYVLVSILFLSSLVLAVIKARSVNGKKGVVSFIKNEIIINEDIYNVALNSIHDIEISIDSTQYKTEKDRGMLSGLANNWVSFFYNNQRIKVEFALPSKEKEKQLNLVLDEWKKNSINFKLKSSEKNFWQKLLK